MLKIKQSIKTNYILFIFLVCLFIFTFITIRILKNNIIQLDNLCYNFISKNMISDKITPIIKIITNFGDAIFLISLTIILIITIKNKKYKLLIPSNLILIALFNIIGKNIVQRTRPIEYRIIDVIGYSFPSGHAMVSTAFYGYLIYLICKNIKKKYLKWIIIILLILLICMINISRIYLGVHYTSDVLAGTLISISYLILFIKVTESNIKFK